MVSTAAGLARHGLLPVVNSFASFLASRANEQIYNQASERHEGRLRAPLRRADPGRPGQVAPVAARHLAARGASGHDDRAARERRGDARAPALGGRGGRRRTSRSGSRSGRRRGGSSSPDELEPGRGRVLREGADAILFAYGPVMLHEALTASELLAERGIGLAVVEHAVAQPLRRASGCASARRASSASSSSRTTRRSAGSATRCAASSAATSRCSASRAGPRAERRPRRCARTGSTAPRSPSASRSLLARPA